jgi:NitT/TauT family transport system substrate-binding protein
MKAGLFAPGVSATTPARVPLRFAAVLVTAAALLLGFASPREARAQAKLENVTMVLPSSKGLPHAPYFIAEAMGYYKEEGLKLDIVNVTGGVEAIKAVASGQAQFSFPAPSSVIAARNSGVPAISVYAQRQMWIFGFAAKEGSGITKFEDLKGKTIGVISESAGLIVQLMLAGSGKLDVKDVKIQVVGGNMAAPLATGAVDAIYTWRALFQQYANRGLKQVWIAGPELEKYQSNVIATTEELVQKRPDLMEKFLRATTKGIVFALANPQAAIDIVGKSDPKLVADGPAAAKEINIVNEELSSDLTRKYGFGYNSDDSFTLHEAAMRKLGLVKATHKAEGYYYTNKFIAAANKFDHAQVRAQAKAYK